MLLKIKKIIPTSWLNQYHKIMAIIANIICGRPSKKMIVIGVTGTNGKSSTVILIAKILEAAGYQVGAASTVLFKIKEQEWLNNKKMTMLGRFQLQKLLKQMSRAGCHYAVIETSSQGIEQFRHLGIHYDVCVFTNLTPEHLEAHGGFENYKQAKLKLFKHLEKLSPKVLSGKKIDKIIVANADDQYVQEFLDFQVDKKITFGINHNADWRATDINFYQSGINFKVADVIINLKLLGKFNIYNSLAAIAVAQSQQIDLTICKSVLEKISGVAGRMELIDVGQKFKVLIDYAPEPESMKQLFQAIKDHQLVSANSKIIHVFGSCGGGRDIARRPILGELSAHNAQIHIITNEDPYDDDPQEIINQVADGALKAGKIENVNLFKILDRRQAIRKALELSQSNDLVLLTGKGAEQAICLANGKKQFWDERNVVKEELIKLNNK